jgi:hypothetical protein
MTSGASTPRALLIAIGVSSVLFLLLSLHLPVALYANAADDDALFSTHAASLYAGHWLGPYDLHTLVKGPGYPLFLALNAVLGLPITLSQALLYALACGLLARSLYRLHGSLSVAVAALVAVEFHPAVFPVQIVRDDISPAQVLLIIVCLLEFMFLQTGVKGRLAWAAAGGFCFVWFWLTREDALWIVPAMAMLGACRLWQCRRRAVPLLTGFFVFAAVAASGWLAVAAVNDAAYGTFSEVDFNTGPFAQAVQQLQRVRVGAPQAYVPVPQKVRLAIYAVSPSFASLQSYLEGPGQSWGSFGCREMPSTCGDIAAGWFAFALRSAVSATGHYSSPQTAADFYRRITDEVSAACAAGRLQCVAPSLRLMPAVTAAQWRQAPADFRKAARLLLMRTKLTRPESSLGNAVQLAAMDNILGRPLRTPATYEGAALELTGWYAATDHGWIAISCDETGSIVLLPVQHYPSPDVAAALHDPMADHARFVLALPSATDCGLQPSPGGGGVVTFAGAKPGPVSFAGARMFLDSVQSNAPVITGTTAEAILRALRWVYAMILPAACVVAIGSCLWCCVVRRQLLTDLAIVAVTFWILALTRVCVLVLVTVSAFPAVIQRYMLPAYPALCVAIVLSIAMFFRRHDESPVD